MKHRYKFLIVALILITLFPACKKTSNTELNAPVEISKLNLDIAATPSKVYILGHKGAGSNNYNPVNMEHSIASIKEAVKVLDGIEIDVQMSLDGTLWLFHDTDLTGDLCVAGPPQSLILMHDKDIAALKLCSRTKKDRVYKFSELIDYWNSTPNGFYISLEVKGDFDAATYKKVGGESAYLTKFANRLSASLQNLKHPSSMFLIEDDDNQFFSQFKKYPVSAKMKFEFFNDIPFDDLIRIAVGLNLSGVSVSMNDSTMTATKIAAAQKKGLTVEVWTPYTDAEVQKIYNLHPDFIQTDHTNVKADLHIK